jgi:hypothetical protein
MDEMPQDSLEQRGRELFDASVDGVDMRIRSRLNQARHVALQAAGGPRARLLRFPLWTSAAGVTAAAVLGIAIWVGMPFGEHPVVVADNQSSFEDLEIVAATDESTGDPIEMLQDDVEFYDWAADKTAPVDSGTVG